MKDRLDKFIKTEGLTPSRFAEIMGVQPSSISHILGGRNKPSFDFIEKMLLRFPKINPDWLLLGKGQMYRSAGAPTSPLFSPGSSESGAPQEIPLNPELFPSTGGRPLPSNGAEAISPESQLSSASEPPSTNRTPQMQEPQLATERVDPNRSIPTQAPLRAENNPLANSSFPMPDEDQIEQVVFFLKDKTFITYRPK